MKRFDINRMSEIILVLAEKFRNDNLVRSMIRHLIRDESDYLVPVKKSKSVEELEKKYNYDLGGVRRKAIYSPKSKERKELSAKINIEHGFEINEAVIQCMEAKTKEDIKSILEKIQNSLVYVTKKENEKLTKERKKIENKNKDFLELYEECDIDLCDNKREKK